MLGTVAGEEVLDLFAGTGALGIEALSRGAKRAVFVERDAGALATLTANLAALELEEGEAEVRRGEAFGALRSARARAETYDLVLIDPPYRRAGAWGRELPAVLEPLLAPTARGGVESDRRASLGVAVGDRQGAALWRHIDHNPPSRMTYFSFPPSTISHSHHQG